MTKHLATITLALLIAGSAPGAITYVGGTAVANSNGGTATTTPALDGHTGNWPAIWVGTTPGSSGACSAAVGDSSGNSYTATVSDAAIISGCLFCPSGTPTVSASMTFHAASADGGWVMVIGAVFAGVPSNFICNQKSHATASPSSTSIQPGTLLPNVPNTLILTGLSNYIASSGTNTVNSGFTLVSQQGSNSVAPNGGLAYLIQTSAGSVNPTWSFGSSDPPATTMVVVEPPGGVAAPTVTLTTFGAPSWSSWVSMRAGVCTGPQLDGSASHGNNFPSTAVTHFWQQVSGPTLVRWADRTAPQPTICGHIFGDYVFRDTVTDDYGNIGTATIETGSVATDSNGVVVQANPAADEIFGPMIAFGKNPWGYADFRHQYATTQRLAQYSSLGVNPALWQTPGAGTVNYVFGGATNLGSGGTTLCTAITSATQMSFDVCDISQIDLSVLPARIMVGTNAPVLEEIRICTKTMVSGNRYTLGVCYDGRGWASSSKGMLFLTPAQAWGNGSVVWQVKVIGSGTNFVTGSLAFCPGQSGVAPYSRGAVTYAVGTVSVTAGSATLTGAGTTWNGTTLPNNDLYEVRVQGTASSTPFSFIAYVNSVADTTHITMSRVFPADADTVSGLSYQIIGYVLTTASLHYANGYGADMQINWNSVGCESDTQFYANPSHDIPRLNNTSQNGKSWSVANKNGTIYNQSSVGGVNFYGEDQTHASLALSSGWSTAQAAWQAMTGMWIQSPYIAGCDAGGLVLYLGGGVIGAITSTVLGAPGAPGWGAIRPCVAKAVNYVASGCNSSFDTRETSYLFAWIALAAKYDTDPDYNPTWLAALAQVYTWENTCKRSDNSWANAADKWGPFTSVGNPNGTFTVGSAIVTGTGFDASQCAGVQTGTITVTNGSANATGTNFPLAYANESGMLVIEGAVGSLPNWWGEYANNGSSTSSITLSTNWPGTNGTYNYIISAGQQYMPVGTSVDDPQLQKSWVCTYNSPTQLTLDRLWDGTPGINTMSESNAGYSQQPFMVGILVDALRWASNVATVNSAGFKVLADAAATWQYTTGTDPITGGLYYVRVNQPSESTVYPTLPPVSPLFDARTPSFNNGLLDIPVARNLVGEGGTAIAQHYADVTTPTVKTWGDHLYGGLYGVSGYTTGGVFTDSNGGGCCTGDAYLTGNSSGAKWPGFYFGMGLARQWPAARLGGVQPAQPRTVLWSGRPPVGGSMVCNLTAPSGAVSVITGFTSCSLVVDDTQGAFLVQAIYKDSGGSITATGPQQIVN